jgi:hypothetical protein
MPAEAAVLAKGIQWLRNFGGATIGEAVVIQGPGAMGSYRPSRPTSRVSCPMRTIGQMPDPTRSHPWALIGFLASTISSDATTNAPMKIRMMLW